MVEGGSCTLLDCWADSGHRATYLEPADSIRWQRVMQIRAALATGTYWVAASTVAEAILRGFHSAQ